MGHTKGKWFWNGGELRTKQKDDKSWEGTVVLHHNKSEEELKANRDLIASAPEMLEALKNAEGVVRLASPSMAGKIKELVDKVEGK